MASRDGWVADLEDRQPIRDALCASLVGHEIVGARYVELAYPEPAWDCGSFHSIDYGVELDTDAGKTTCFIWQQKGRNETLLTYSGTIRDELVADAEVSTWDVGGTWHSALPGPVHRVETVWMRHRWGPSFGGPKFKTRVAGEGKSDYCLITVLLSNDTGDSVIVTLGGEANGPVPGTFTDLADNVAVFLSASIAWQAGAVLPGDPDGLVL